MPADADKTVSTEIHSRPFAAAVASARLVVLPGVVHMVPNAAPELVACEIEMMIGAGRSATGCCELNHRVILRCAPFARLEG